MMIYRRYAMFSMHAIEFKETVARLFKNRLPCIVAATPERANPEALHRGHLRVGLPEDDSATHRSPIKAHTIAITKPECTRILSIKGGNIP